MRPFIFKSQLNLVEMTGLKAASLEELSIHLKAVPESSIYQHTHHFLQQHQFLTPEPPNDFSFWVGNVLQDDLVAEKISAIDTVRSNSLEELRRALIRAIEPYVHEESHQRTAPPGEEFHFMKCIVFTLPTPYTALNLEEFVVCLRRISIHCLYNHVFSARLRPPLGMSDLSNWLLNELGEKALAQKIQKLDPYTWTLEGLRTKIIGLVEDRISEARHA